MDEDTTTPQLQITSSPEATFKVAMISALIGTAVSFATYFLVRGVAVKTIENSNILLNEEFDIFPKNREE